MSCAQFIGSDFDSLINLLRDCSSGCVQQTESSASRHLTLIPIAIGTSPACPPSLAKVWVLRRAEYLSRTGTIILLSRYSTASIAREWNHPSPLVDGKRVR